MMEKDHKRIKIKLRDLEHKATCLGLGQQVCHRFRNFINIYK